MFISMLELTAAGMALGAAAMYTLKQQKRMTVLIFLLFVCAFYIGSLLSRLQWLQGVQADFVVDVLRLLIIGTAAVTGMISYLPYYGFFHARAGYFWMAVSFLFIFIGWHYGQWGSTIIGAISMSLLFAAAFVMGNTLQSVLHVKMRGRFFVPYLPFAGLLFFSFFMLL
ncbi:hypothetical protein [Salibacterium sp. K-3]